jgi:hypothetical protein
MKPYTTFLAAALSLAGCATPVTPVVHGGSRADGIVVMRGDYGLYRSADINWDAAKDQAVATCRGWGYYSAKAFDTYQYRCANGASTPIGCASTEVFLRFQCIGS